MPTCPVSPVLRDRLTLTLRFEASARSLAAMALGVRGDASVDFKQSSPLSLVLQDTKVKTNHP